MSAMSRLLVSVSEPDTQVTIGHLVCLLDPSTAFDLGYDSGECEIVHALVTLLRQTDQLYAAQAMERGHAERHDWRQETYDNTFCPLLDTNEGNRP